MRKIIGIGETLLDIVFRQGSVVASQPAGSTLNAITTLALCGHTTVMLSQTSSDVVGDHILQAMRDNGIDTRFVQTATGSKTPIALAILDKEDNANYTFYRDTPNSDRNTDADLCTPLPDIMEDDIVICGSYYAIDPSTHSRVMHILQHARERGAIVYYDINYRPSHKQERDKLMPNIERLLSLADVVRGSADDFLTLADCVCPDTAFSTIVAPHAPNLIFTAGKKPTTVFAPGIVRRDYPTPPVSTVSTIGAGDNFNAGIIHAIVRQGITRRQLHSGLAPSLWDTIVSTAQQFAANSCTHIGNNVTTDFANNQRQQQ